MKAQLIGLWAGLLILAYGPPATHAASEGLEAGAVKAGFVYNFSKFVDWPAGVLSGAGTMRLCVAGMGLEGKLAQIQGRISQGREIQVSQLAGSGEVGSCHILFVGASERYRLNGLLQAAGGNPVLTVSDIEDFTGSGGMIGLFVENGRVRFAINPGAMRAVGLKPSAQLVRLGRVEP